jgi:chromate transporter
VTPGPILISAAFIGYKVAGPWGALSATLGIFSPPAVLMIASSLALQHIKRSPSVKAILAGIRPVVVGMIFAAAVVIGRTAPPHWLSLLIFAASLYALLRLKIDVVWIIPAAGVLGLLL